MKRLLAFLVLLVGGFLLLEFLVEDEQPAAKSNGAQTQQPRPRTPDGPGVQVQGGGTGIQANLSGPLRIGQVRLVPTGDGSRKEPVYELSCENTVPLADGTFRLERVTVQLFDAGQHSADLTAAQATVALREDQNGRRSIREDKDLELTRAVLDAVPGSRFGELHMECGRLRAKIADDAFTLTTPDGAEPVLVRVGGARAGTLRGKGLTARMPKDRGAEAGVLDLVIQNEPELATQGFSARADGALHYVETLGSGAATLTLERAVVLGLEAALGGLSDGRTQAHGDRLLCALRRPRHSAAHPGREVIVWDRIQLTGAPAHVDHPTAALQSPKLAVLPGLDGKPAVITAHGGPAQLVQREGDRGPATFRSPRPIHWIQPRASLGALHEHFGFPAFALRPLRDVQILSFEGASELEAADGVRVQTEGPLALYQFGGAVGRPGPILSRGHGAVRIEQGTGAERTVATGDRGFTWIRTADDDRLTLGVDGDPKADQHFRLERGELLLQGQGVCRLRRSADGAAELDALSGADAIDGTFGADLGRIEHAAFLRATVRQGELSALHAGGERTAFAFARRGQRFAATAADLLQTSRASWRLSGTAAAPARIERPAQGKEPAGELSAPRIELHRVGADAVMLDAQAGNDAMARFRATQLPGISADSRAEVTAERIRLLPFALPRVVRRSHFAGVPDLLADRMDPLLGRAWVMAEGQVTAALRDERHGETRGRGARLLLSQGALAGLWLGDAAQRTAATIENLSADGRRTTAAGARIRFFRAEGDRIDVLTTFADGSAPLPPWLELHDGRSTASGPLAHLHATCDGEIRVHPDVVRFLGPVAANSLTPEGQEAADSMRVAAQHLEMKRAPDTGNVIVIDASGGVTVAWKELRARSDKVEIDLRWQRCIASDPAGAELSLGSRRYRARRIEANYVNYSVRTWFGGFAETGAAAENR